MSTAARLAADADLHVGRVVLRGSAAAVEHARATLPAALARMRWPAAGDDEILVLRQLAVRGDASELPARAAVAAGELARHAADPWSPAADSADAVRFRSPLDYRACLIRDLLAGTAARRWLWRHRAALLARPPAAALAELLGEDALMLPALLDRVAARSALPALWRTLAAPSARELLHAIGAATGWARAIATALDADAGSADGVLRDAAPGVRSEAAQTVPVPRPQGTPSAGLPGDLPAADPRVVLHAVLALWAATPAALARSDAGTLLRETARALVRATPTAAMTRPAANEERGAGPDAPASETTAPFSEPRSSDLEPAAARDTPTRPTAPAIPAPTENAATEHRPSGNAPAAPRSPPIADSATKPPISSVAASPATLPPAAEHDFHTRGGGFFFLLNVLNLPALRDWRATLDEPQAGWRALVRLARTVDFAPDLPLAAFLADACGLDDQGDAATALGRMPASTDPDTVLRPARRHFGDATLRAALAERPARVLATRSHVDVHLRLADASLDIRRVGLDLDPGWLPWLGRVVRFHYDSGGFTP